MKRILLIANKSWEAEPIVNALLNKRFSTLLTNPIVLNYPWTFQAGSLAPLAIWKLENDVIVELWCIQHIMSLKWNSSSSEGKNKELPRILNFSSSPPSLVIALGTAAFTSKIENRNGCVVIGSNVFIHNYHPNGSNPESKWDDSENFEKLIYSKIADSFFDLFQTIIPDIEKNLLKPFLHPAHNIELLISKDYTALSVVNVTNYKEYDDSDKSSLEALENSGSEFILGSLETTHGIIRLLGDYPFVFMSGITDRFLKFSDDVNGKDEKGNIKTEAQNFTCSFNIGIALGNLIPVLAKWKDL